LKSQTDNPSLKPPLFQGRPRFFFVEYSWKSPDFADISFDRPKKGAPFLFCQMRLFFHAGMAADDVPLAACVGPVAQSGPASASMAPSPNRRPPENRNVFPRQSGELVRLSGLAAPQ